MQSQGKKFVSVALVSIGVTEQAEFLRWLSSKLQGDIYPGSPFERKYFALLLLNHLLDIWCQGQPVNGRNQKERLPFEAFQTCFSGMDVFPPDFLDADSCLALIGRQAS